ncbi:hypothetical protein ISP15_14040 [Dyella jejuensis]|uniref:Uncharacterized protein n=1 Tax=Dyella jejuensis TaxID=1432009 RepID=A0ABW8JJZ7_9GAMM
MTDKNTVLGYTASAPTVSSHSPATITDVYSNYGDDRGPIYDGGTSYDIWPDIEGQAMPNSLVYIYDGSTLLGSTHSNAQGYWVFSLEKPLGDGSHVFKAAAAGEPAGADFSMTVIAPPPSISEVQDRVGDIQGTYYSGSTIDDAHPSLSGYAEAGSLVTIYSDGRLITTVTANEYGGWNTAIDLPQGTYHLVAVDAAGRTSAPFDVTVVAPKIDPAPTIDRIYGSEGGQGGLVSEGGTTETTRPNLSGTAAPLSLVTIYDGDLNHPIGTARADGWGTWQFMPLTDLAQGTHQFIVATASSAPSAAFVIDIEPVAPPAAVVITSVYDDAGASHGYLSSGAITDDTQPLLQGTAVPDSLVTIYDGDRNHPIGTAQAGQDGQWKFMPGTPLSDGEHHFIATTEHSAPSAEFTVTIVTAPVSGEAPAITSLFDYEGAQQGAVHQGDTTDATHPTLCGTGVPNSIVTIYDGDLSHVLGSARVYPDGSWNFTPDAALGDGLHNLIAAGGDGAISAPFTVTIDSAVIPPIAMPPEILHVSDADHAAAGLWNDSTTINDPRPLLHGLAAPNTLVTIYDGDRNHPVGTAQAGQDGQWKFMPGTPLSEGAHHFIATTEHSAASAEFTVTIVTAPASGEAPAITSLFDYEGAQQGAVHQGDTTDATHPTLCGTGVPNSIVTIYDGDLSHVLGSARVYPDGSWNFTPDAALGDGLHNLIAAGADGATSAPFTVTIDSAGIPPITTPVLSIDVAMDNVGFYQGALQNGAHTDDTTPTLQGSAAANSMVIVADGTHVLGTATANEFGQWRFTPEQPLEPGAHPFTVTDAQGGRSAPYAITIDTPTSAPVIDHAHDNTAASQGDFASGGVVHDTHPTLVGYAPAGSVVTIADGDQVLGVARATNKGEWTFSMELGDGVHHLTASTANGSSESFVLIVEAPVAGNAINALSVADVLHGGETELFAMQPVHDDASLVLHGVDGDQGNGVAKAPVAMSNDVALLNIHQALPHEAITTHVM